MKSAPVLQTGASREHKFSQNGIVHHNMSENQETGKSIAKEGMSDPGQNELWVSIKVPPTTDGANFCRVRYHLSTLLKIHLSPSAATPIADLKVVELCLESLDRAVSQLEVLVQAIAFRDQLDPNASAFSPSVELCHLRVVPIA